MKKKKELQIKKNDVIIGLIALALFGLVTFIKNIKYGLFISILFIFIYVVINEVKRFNKSKNRKNKIKPTNMKDIEVNYAKINKPNKNKTKKKKRVWTKVVLIIFSVGFLAVVGFGTWFTYTIIKEAPKFDPKNLYMSEPSIVYDINGKEMAKLGSENREVISYEEMPEVLIDALIATEDSRFFQHNGFDLPRFAKASIGQVIGNREAGGASTLTMQIVKNNYTSTEASGWDGIKRKFTDIYMSIFKVEKQYTKKEIIELYLNSHFLGERSYGVEQASLTYFGKSAKDLNLAEAAMIVGLFNAPHSFNPYLFPEDAETRRQDVLYLMKLHKYISKEEYEIAKSMNIETLLSRTEVAKTKYQGFIDTVVEEVIKDTGLDPYSTSMQIYSTMEPQNQDHINKIISGEIFDWENEVVNTGIAVVNTKTGAISAVGAGRNRQGEKQYNTATMIKRQIGSTAKPLYDYGPAIEVNGWSPGQPIVDEPHTYSNGVRIDNWDRGFKGMMTARRALVESRNIPALKAFQATDNAGIYNFVTKLGLSPESTDGSLHESHSLGGYTGESPLSVASAYAAFGNKGVHIDPYSYTKIIYRDSSEEQLKEIKKQEAMSPATAYIMTNILEETAKFALYQWADVGGAAYGAKTGTTNFSDDTIKEYGLPSDSINDLWVAGVSPDYAIAVWYGYDKITSENVTRWGNRNCYRIFQAVAKGVFKKGSTFERPDDVISFTIEKETNPVKRPSEFTPDNMKTTDLFRKGTEPTEVSTRYSRLNDPSNLTGSSDGTTVTLNWDGIALPDGINESVFSKEIANIYIGGYQTSALGSRIGYNNAYIGSVGYNVYKIDSAGLSLLGFTSATNYSYDVDSTAEPIKFVVKSAYSIFKSNMSAGIETTVEFDGTTSVIKSDLNGTDVNLALNSSYTDSGVTVFENNKDVTANSKILIEIKDKSGNIVNGLNNIDTSSANIYTIVYTITYKNHNNILRRKIIIA